MFKKPLSICNAMKRGRVAIVLLLLAALAASLSTPVLARLSIDHVFIDQTGPSQYDVFVMDSAPSDAQLSVSVVDQDWQEFSSHEPAHMVLGLFGPGEYAIRVNLDYDGDHVTRYRFITVP